MAINYKLMKLFILLVWIIGAASWDAVYAAPREAGGNAKIVNKLQLMVKDITAERDLLKTDNAKMASELETVKSQLAKEQAAVVSLEEKSSTELSAQKATADEIRLRLDNTTAKLREVIEKYNALNKSKNELAVEHTGLQNNQQLTASELKQCESKNIKMYEGAKEIIDAYHNCQNKGIVDTLIGTEPFLQIKNVEFETIIQEFEDKLNKQKYHANPNALPAPSKAGEARK
ncbi:MAG: hypothetical protein Q7U57_07095 [Methylovulum sp.]|nr:hypothetical protein [Methylovulum sp.]